ncbi:MULTISPECIES: hypothetical protein [unclassified Arthrobacter]|nr:MULTISPECIES: hypothetical protein [unclassified Arthrobacter]
MRPIQKRLQFISERSVGKVEHGRLVEVATHLVSAGYEDIGTLA